MTRPRHQSMTQCQTRPELAQRSVSVTVGCCAHSSQASGPSLSSAHTHHAMCARSALSKVAQAQILNRDPNQPHRIHQRTQTTPDLKFVDQASCPTDFVPRRTKMCGVHSAVCTISSLSLHPRESRQMCSSSHKLALTGNNHRSWGTFASSASSFSGICPCPSSWRTF